MSAWSPISWQEKTAAQQPVYPDGDQLERVVAEMSRLPPLVTSWEVEALKQQLGEAARGEVFLLQGGDCAESFDDCDASAIAAKLKILLQMSLILVHATRKRVIRVGRIAGQYAKPRSEDQESRGAVTLPTYRGDIVNRSGFTSAERIPDPELLLRGYERAALTLNFIRALADGGFAEPLVELHGRADFYGMPVPDTDIYIDATGVKSVVENVLNNCKFGITLVVVGLHKQDVPVSFTNILAREITIKGSMAYPTEFPQVIEMLASGEADVAAMVSHRFALPQFEQAFASASDASAAAKVIVTMQ